MKKLLTLSNILKASAALLGIIAFVMMFTKQLWIGNSSNKAFVDFKDALFDKDFGSAISFVGYLFLLIGGLGMCALIFLKDKKMVKLLAMCLAGALLLGAIFVFIEAAVVNGRIDSSLIKYNLTAGPVLAGIFGILAALLGCGSEFLKK